MRLVHEVADEARLTLRQTDILFSLASKTCKEYTTRVSITQATYWIQARRVSRKGGRTLSELGREIRQRYIRAG